MNATVVAKQDPERAAPLARFVLFVFLLTVLSEETRDTDRISVWLDQFNICYLGTEGTARLRLN